jgi:D-beta-D-heptose 7-phosphate kinase/D-beta-D-heptose 1-phosphate adenosyltransferase
VTTRNQQVARIDYERDGEVSGHVQQAIVSKIEELAGSAAAILISDYMKGAISRDVAQGAAAAARRHGIPLLVDPKVPHVGYYSGATVVTPNHHEAEAVTHMRIRSADDASRAAKRLREIVGCECVLITRGEHGMWLLDREREADLPAEAREVADVTGAGDTVISALALGLAAGGSLTDAARIANRAAGIVVGRFGPATVTLAELEAAR